MRALRKPVGDLPVLALTRGVSRYAVLRQPLSVMNKATENENAQLQKECAALLSRGGQRVVMGACHVIEAEQPQAVVDAVLELLKQVK